MKTENLRCYINIDKFTFTFQIYTFKQMISVTFQIFRITWILLPPFFKYLWILKIFVIFT